MGTFCRVLNLRLWKTSYNKSDECYFQSKAKQEILIMDRFIINKCIAVVGMHGNSCSDTILPDIVTLCIKVKKKKTRSWYWVTYILDTTFTVILFSVIENMNDRMSPNNTTLAFWINQWFWTYKLSKWFNDWFRYLMNHEFFTIRLNKRFKDSVIHS